MDTTVLVSQLREIGLKPGDVVMTHSSFKSLGIRDPEQVILALIEVLGDNGTLLMPALSYTQEPPTVHDTNLTPTCVGFLTEYFRMRAGTLRSVHPTHSVCALGNQANAWIGDHITDNTPCGAHSPFNKLLQQHGKILFIGCGLHANTCMHAIEEYARPTYLFGTPLTYTITDAQRRTFEKEYIPHDFSGVNQRYDRAEDLLPEGALSKGALGDARTILLQAAVLFQVALQRMRVNPFYFVDRMIDS
jgi:aminoglycoside 3-N-acetyltransferase